MNIENLLLPTHHATTAQPNHRRYQSGQQHRRRQARVTIRELPPIEEDEEEQEDRKLLHHQKRRPNSLPTLDFRPWRKRPTSQPTTTTAGPEGDARNEINGRESLMSMMFVDPTLSESQPETNPLLSSPPRPASLPALPTAGAMEDSVRQARLIRRRAERESLSLSGDDDHNGGKKEKRKVKRLRKGQKGQVDDCLLG